MTDRATQKRLDDLAMDYLAAVEKADFDRVEAFWEEAALDANLEGMLHGLHAELAAEREALDDSAHSGLATSRPSSAWPARSNNNGSRTEHGLHS